MEDLKERVKEEEKELVKKLLKLEEFIWEDGSMDCFTDKFKKIPDVQQSLLISQIQAMYAYKNILTHRIKTL